MVEVLRTLGPKRSVTDRSASRPLVLEVGCGHGEAAVALATGRPDLDVVAADVHTPGIVHLLEQAEAAGLGNVFVERADALDLLAGGLRDVELAGVHLFFPDPWPKARHRKRRFVRPDVLDLLADRLARGAPLLVATDVADYARGSIEHLDRHRAFAGGIAPRPAWRPVTRYEAAAIDAGRPVTELRYTRR